MLNTFQDGSRTQCHAFTSDAVIAAAERRATFDRNRHRVYSISFWMTGNELAAEDLMADAFRLAFSTNSASGPEEVDQALVAELRKTFDLPVFTLNCTPSTEVRNVRRNALRVELENAVLQLPATEKLIFLLHDVERYDHDGIARLLGITERESNFGLHQARLRLREILAN